MTLAKIVEADPVLVALQNELGKKAIAQAGKDARNGDLYLSALSVRMAEAAVVLSNAAQKMQQ